MFRFDTQLKVYVHREAVDFRKSINGLAALVEQALGLDPFAAALYVFGNRRRNRVKILGWETNGFWLLLKRLEAERFVWPRSDRAVIELTIEQLHWLLEGIDLEAMRAHRILRYRRAS
jgi:transposase